MAVIMMDVEEAAERLNELVDEVMTGSEVIVGREGRPLTMMVPFESVRNPGAPAGSDAGRGRSAEPPPEPGPTSGSDGGIIVERRRIVVYLP